MHNKGFYPRPFHEDMNKLFFSIMIMYNAAQFIDTIVVKTVILKIMDKILVLEIMMTTFVS